MIKKLLSASLIYALAPQLPKLVSLFMMPFITAHMTSLDYGISGIIFAYVAGFESLKDLGLRVTLTNSFFKYPNRYSWVWKRILGLLHIWAIIFSFLLVFVLTLVLPEEAKNDSFKILILVILPFLLFDPPVSMGRYYFQYSKKPIPISIISAIGGIITVFANYYFIVVEEWGFMGLIVSQFFAQCFNFLIYAYFVYGRLDLRPSFRFNKKWVKKHLTVALPTIPHYYAGYIINIFDRILLDWFQVPIQQIGLYSFAYGFGTYFSIIGKSFQTASGPYYMEHNREENISGDQKNKRLTELAQAGLLVTAFSLVLFLPEIFDLLVKNDELKATYRLSAIVIFAYTYFPIYAIIGMKLWYTESTKLMMKITVGAAVLSIVMNFLLIPFFGITGSAISTLISLFFMAYAGHFQKTITSQFQAIPNAIFWFSSSILTLMLGLLIMELNWMIKGSILLFVLLVLAALFVQKKKPIRVTNGF